MSRQQGKVRSTLGALLVALGAWLPMAAASAADAATGADAQSAPPASTAVDDATDLETIHVIAITPQQGASLPEMMIPYNVQSTTSGELDRTQSLSITDYMNHNMTGVTINSAQNNPLQPNLQFRGFTASPLLGGSQGVSVYLDGVRVNEVFGDSVNWDLIPEELISTMSLLSGANPKSKLNRHERRARIASRKRRMLRRTVSVGCAASVAHDFAIAASSVTRSAP